MNKFLSQIIAFSIKYYSVKTKLCKEADIVKKLPKFPQTGKIILIGKKPQARNDLFFKKSIKYFINKRT